MLEKNSISYCLHYAYYESANIFRHHAMLKLGSRMLVSPSVVQKIVTSQEKKFLLTYITTL